MPANLIPEDAHRNGAFLIEVNMEPSLYTHRLTDLYLEGPAARILGDLVALLLPEHPATLTAASDPQT
jgi:NAD-dependent deacetylase